MSRVRGALRDGVFFIGWKGAAFCVLLGVANYVTSLGYDYLNHGPYRLFLRTPLDQALPVVPLFVVPYVSLKPFLYGSLVIFLVFRARIFQSAVLSMIATFLVSYLFFAFMQSYVDRPVLTGNDGLTRMIRDVYAGAIRSTTSRACTSRCRRSWPFTGGASAGRSGGPWPSALG